MRLRTTNIIGSGPNNLASSISENLVRIQWTE